MINDDDIEESVIVPLLSNKLTIPVVKESCKNGDAFENKFDSNEDFEKFWKEKCLPNLTVNYNYISICIDKTFWMFIIK